MNNADFRRLVSDTPQRSAQDASPSGGKSQAASRGRFGIPMTPRTIRGDGSVDFARQLAEQNQVNRPSKKFKSSRPKGMTLADGYKDRAQDRMQRENDDELAERLKALEEQVKLGQLDRNQFERLRDDLTGGDISKTHLVKGLDRKLLERVRRGEDVMNVPSAQSTEELEAEKEVTVDAEDELDELATRDFKPVEREQREKRGERSSQPVAGVKRSRNDILAEMKAQRQAAIEAEAAARAQKRPGFKKIGGGAPKEPTSRIERDSKGREVLITIDEQGNVKRKVRKASLQAPDPKVKPLGSDIKVPGLPQANDEEDEDDDDDIFKDAGDDYDPLAEFAGQDDADSDSSDDSDNEQKQAKEVKPKPPAEEMSPVAPAQAPRNYFNDLPSTAKPTEEPKPLQDPAILAAIKRAAAIEERNSKANGSDEDGEDTTEKGRDRETRPSTAAERLLAQQDRDYEDMDLGFGSSRMGDEEDGEDGQKVRFSKWTGGRDDGDGEDGDGHGRGGQQRKRGKKKRKGDKNSAADVLRVMEARRK